MDTARQTSDLFRKFLAENTDDLETHPDTDTELPSNSDLQTPVFELPPASITDDLETRPDTDTEFPSDSELQTPIFELPPDIRYGRH